MPHLQESYQKRMAVMLSKNERNNKLEQQNE